MSAREKIAAYLRAAPRIATMEPEEVADLVATLGAARPEEIALATMDYLQDMIAANRDGLVATRDAMAGAGGAGNGDSGS